MKTQVSLFLLLALGACKGDDSESSKSEAPKPAESSQGAASSNEGIAGHCDQISDLSYCTDTPYSSQAWKMLGEQRLADRCNGEYHAKTSCPADARIGSCLAVNKEVLHYYASGNGANTAPLAEAECKEKIQGTWTPVN